MNQDGNRLPMTVEFQPAAFKPWRKSLIPAMHGGVLGSDHGQPRLLARRCGTSTKSVMISRCVNGCRIRARFAEALPRSTPHRASSNPISSCNGSLITSTLQYVGQVASRTKDAELANRSPLKNQFFQHYGRDLRSSTVVHRANFQDSVCVVLRQTGHCSLGRDYRQTANGQISMVAGSSRLCSEVAGRSLPP